MKIKTLLTIVFLLFSLTAAIAFAVAAEYYLGNETEEQYISFIDEAAEKQSSNVELYIKSVESGFAALAEMAEAVDEEEREAFLNSYAEGRDDITALIILAEDDDGFSVEFSTDAAYTDGINPTDFAENDDRKVYLFNETEKSTSDEYGIAVKAETEFGVLVAAYSGETVKNIAGSISMPGNGGVILIDPGENIIYNSQYDKLSRSALPSEFVEIRTLVASNDSSVVFTVGKIKRVAGHSAIDDVGWSVVTLGSISAIRSEATGSTGLVIALAVIICLLGIVMTFVVVSRFTKPLTIISRTIMQIRRGDHDARINVMSKNEYGDIARLFNDLIDDMVVGESRYRTIIEMSDNIIFEWNKINNEVSFSNNFNKKFSYRAPSDHFGDSFLLKCKIHPDDAARYREDLEKLGKGEDFKHNEYRIKNIYNDYTWVLMRTASIKNSNGDVTKTVGVLVDIDRAKKSEETLVNRASYDALTGVFNRDSIESLVENEIDLTSARREAFAVLFVDIDDFKDFNDKYSHATGDQVLKFTAQTLNNIVAGFGMVGRYGGDEYIVCVRNCSVNEPTKIAQEILTRLKEGYTADTDDRISIDASIGVVIVRDSTQRVEMVIGAADDAMYKIKKSGKSNYFVLDDNNIVEE